MMGLSWLIELQLIELECSAGPKPDRSSLADLLQNWNMRIIVRAC